MVKYKWYFHHTEDEIEEEVETLDKAMKDALELEDHDLGFAIHIIDGDKTYKRNEMIDYWVAQGWYDVSFVVDGF